MKGVVARGVSVVSGKFYDMVHKVDTLDNIWCFKKDYCLIYPTRISQNVFQILLLLHNKQINYAKSIKIKYQDAEELSQFYVI